MRRVLHLHIYLVRGLKVMLDLEAALHEVETTETTHLANGAGARSRLWAHQLTVSWQMSFRIKRLSGHMHRSACANANPGLILNTRDRRSLRKGSATQLVSR